MSAINIFINQSACRYLLSLILLAVILCGNQSIMAQSMTEVSGIVTDDDTNEPLPFVNIYFQGTGEGTVSDESGYFSLKSSQSPKFATVSFVGYDQQIIPIKPGQKQIVTITLKNQLVNLDEVVVLSGENPAWAIVRQAVNNKKKFDKRSLKSYEYQSYNRIELDIDNISTKLSKRKIVQDIWEGIDTTALEKNENGKAILPVFLSESVSRYYVKNDPYARREEVQKSQISGLAVEDGSMISQLTGAAYQNYNFYQNWLTILDKEFISPIADGWKAFYDYEILDTLFIDKRLCYELEVFPNRAQDPAFNGKIWITTNDFAAIKFDLYLNQATNLNFIEKLELKQELEATELGPLLPSYTNVLIDVSNLGKNTASILAKFLITTSDRKINDVKDNKFYANEVFLAEDLNNYESVYWDSVRPLSLSAQDMKTYQVIDTLVEIPRVKSYVELLKLITTGYWRRGKIDYGPYLFAYAHNGFEGNSLRLGLKTNEYFSDKFTIRAYGGYGTSDKKWKYGLSGSYILNRKPWTEFTVSSSYQLQQVGINAQELLENNYIFYAATRWGSFLRPYYLTDNSFSFQTEPTKGLMHKLTLSYEFYDPQYDFYYYEYPGVADSPLKSTVTTPSITFTTRWARDEMFLQDGNERVSMGTRRSPIIQFDYTYGLKNILDSDFEYNKLKLTISHKLRLGGLGESYYTVTGGYIIGQLPYLLLENHIGNESSFYTTGAYNTMNYFEFVSDEWASLQYSHYFQGLIMNKIPLMRKLKWRLLATANILFGSLSQQNIDIISPTDPEGNPTASFNHLNPAVPYVELGYGIENIFKVLRVDGIHRITYRNDPNAQKYVIKFSFQFKL